LWKSIKKTVLFRKKPKIGSEDRPEAKKYYINASFRFNPLLSGWNYFFIDTVSHRFIMLRSNSLCERAGLNSEASAFLAACCGVSERIMLTIPSLGIEDSPELAPESFNFIGFPENPHF